MPIYEYRCESCQNSFEALVTRSEPQAECPGCGSQNLAREMSVFASSVQRQAARRKPRVLRRCRADAAAAAAATDFPFHWGRSVAWGDPLNPPNVNRYSISVKI